MENSFLHPRATPKSVLGPYLKRCTSVRIVWSLIIVVFVKSVLIHQGTKTMHIPSWMGVGIVIVASIRDGKRKVFVTVMAHMRKLNGFYQNQQEYNTFNSLRVVFECFFNSLIIHSTISFNLGIKLQFPLPSPMPTNYSNKLLIWPIEVANINN